MNWMKKAVLPFLALLVVAAIGVCVAAAPGQERQSFAVTDEPSPSPAALLASPDVTASVVPASAVAPAPTPMPIPQPCNFLTAAFTGRDAAVFECLMDWWGFHYSKSDGKWTDADKYEYQLFQRWAGLEPTGTLDTAGRKKLEATYLKYKQNKIPRQRLPLEGRFIGVNAGHQQKADHGLEPLSPETGSPKKAKVSSGTQGISTRVPEYEVTLQVALKLRDQLEAKGARVLMVRTTNNVCISNVERCKMMNNADVGVYISLHCDGSANRKIHGLHTLIPANRGYQTGTVLKNSQLLAKLMQAEEIKATGAEDRGFSTRRDLSSFNWSKAPTCLIEMSYMTYKAEDKNLVTATYQTKLACGITAAFVKYFQQVK